VRVGWRDVVSRCSCIGYCRSLLLDWGQTDVNSLLFYFRAFYYLSLPLASSFSFLGSSHDVGSCGGILMATHFSFAIETVVTQAYSISMGPTVSPWIKIRFPRWLVEWWASVGASTGWRLCFDASHFGDAGCVCFEKLLDMFC
jgi:hypothetical protein